MDPLIKLAVDIKNAEQIKALTADLNVQKQAVVTLNSALAQGTINQAQYHAAMAVTGIEAQKLSNQLQAMQSAAGGTGRGLGQLAYAIDDLQYGFNAIVNNIPGIVMGLGGGAGIAGAVGIAAVAVNQLMKHWNELGAMLQSNWSGGGAEQLKMLAERADDAAKAWENLKKAQPQLQKEAGASAEKFIAEGPPEDLQKRLTDLMMATGQGAEKRTLVPATGLAGVIQRALGRVTTPGEQSLMQYRDTGAKAARLLGETQLGGQAAQKAFDQLRSMVKQHPGVFKPETEAAIERTDPQALQRQKNIREQMRYEDALREQENAQRAKNMAEQERYMQSLQSKEDAQRQHNIAEQERYMKQLQSQEDAQRNHNIAEQKRFMQQQQNEQDAKVRETAGRFSQSPLGRMMLAGQLKEGDVAARLGQVGGNKALAPEVFAQMKAATEDEIKKRMAETGVGRERARQELILENIMRNNPEFGREAEEDKKDQQKSTYSGLVEFSKQLQMGAFAEKEIPKKQLTETQKTNKLLAEIFGQGRVAPGMVAGP